MGVDLPVGVNISEDMIEGELINVVHFYFAFLASESLLDGNFAHLVLGERTDFSLFFVDGPGLDIFELFEERAHADSYLDFLGFLHVTTR